MTSFRYVPMETAAADRFRQTGLDDGGNALRRSHADHPLPCRHCLQDAHIGEVVLLGSYRFGRPYGIYGGPSPIFVHARPCTPFDRGDAVPEIVRNRLVSVRVYDADDQMIYPLGMVCPGTEVENPVSRSFEDPRTAYVNIHTAGPGCFLCRAERG